MTLIPSLEASRHLPGTMTACSWTAGWRSLLLRAYEDSAKVEEFTTPSTADHLIVLVTGGACNIEARYRGRWDKASYKVGSIGMTAPGQDVSLRWHGNTRHRTLQLHIPAATIRSVIEEVSGRPANLVEMPSKLDGEDPLIESIIRALSDAVTEGVPDIYAESAAHLLTTHLLVRHAKLAAGSEPGRDDFRLKRADAFIRENLTTSISLDAIAKQAGLSRFHLLRCFRQVYGETPFKRIVRLRMEEAQRRLRQGNEPVAAIAFRCGYENPAHFAYAFRRLVGVSPSRYRRASR